MQLDGFAVTEARRASQFPTCLGRSLTAGADRRFGTVAKFGGAVQTLSLVLSATPIFGAGADREKLDTECGWLVSD